MRAEIGVRRCVNCREMKPRTEMVRLTASHQEKQFSIDGNPPLQGRSAYVCRNQPCLLSALKAKKLQRSLKRVIPDDILSNLNRILEGFEK